MQAEWHAEEQAVVLSSAPGAACEHPVVWNGLPLSVRSQTQRFQQLAATKTEAPRTGARGGRGRGGSAKKSKRGPAAGPSPGSGSAPHSVSKRLALETEAKALVAARGQVAELQSQLAERESQLAALQGRYQGHTWCTATPCTSPSVHC